MTVLLRSLGGLVTSRYHASVLSMAAGVPQVAVGHDLRLRTLFEELGLGRCFVSPGADGDLSPGTRTIWTRWSRRRRRV